jgi:hypothetical protein
VVQQTLLLLRCGIGCCSLSCSTKNRCGSNYSTTNGCGIGRCGPSFSTTNRCSSNCIATKRCGIGRCRPSFSTTNRCSSNCRTTKRCGISCGSSCGGTKLGPSYLPCKKRQTGAHVSKRDQFWDQYRGAGSGLFGAYFGAPDPLVQWRDDRGGYAMHKLVHAWGQDQRRKGWVVGGTTKCGAKRQTHTLSQDHATTK